VNDPSSVRAFRLGLRRHGPALDLTGLDHEWLQAEAARCVAAADRLRGYNAFLAQCRARKAQHQLPHDAERELAVRARTAFEHAGAMATSALLGARHAVNSGVLDQAFAAISSGVAAAGQVTVRALWHEIAGMEGTRALLQATGISGEIHDAIAAALEGSDITLTAIDDGVRVAAAGREPVVLRRRRGGPPQSPADLLLGGAFETVVEAIARGEAPVLDVNEAAAAEGKDHVVVDPLDAMLAGTVTVRQLVAAHVRKLEDTGLALYEGASPVVEAVVIGVIVAGIVLTVAGIVLIPLCPMLTNSADDRASCQDIGQLLLFAGGALLAVGTGAALVISVSGNRAFRRPLGK
jgi:hypothetical protein